MKVTSSNHKHTLILSPHLDDAVLSCGSYCLKEIQQNNKVTILTLFTKFSNHNLPDYSIHYLHRSGCNTVEAFQDQRKNEDIQAMQALGADWQHDSLIDGGFRLFQDNPIYPTYEALFSGKISNKDNRLMKQLEKDLKQYDGQFDLILVPWGIGKHADHIITRKCAEKSISISKLGYYLDYPYALSWQNWTLQNFISILMKNFHMILPTPKKQAILKLYTSQYALLFNHKPPKYPEVIIY